jgi:hypothetical protein
MERRKGKLTGHKAAALALADGARKTKAPALRTSGLMVEL